MLQKFVPAEFNEQEALRTTSDLVEIFQARRTVRDFSDETFPREILENALAMANMAPSGGNRQPWTFCIIEDPSVKEKIKTAAELVEKDFYVDRPNHNWLNDLKSFGTNEKKDYITEAPYLIVIFTEYFAKTADNGVLKNYYANESVGIATGFLLASLHMAGLACLTYTPKNMKFLGELLERPSNERAFLILVVGQAKPAAQVPCLTKKTLQQVLKTYARKDIPSGPAKETGENIGTKL